MGTNYYLYDKPDCAACGRPHPARHIGKSSGGWCFSLHVIPEDGIHALADWRAEWSKPGAIIRNEYGEPIEGAEMDAIIQLRVGRMEWHDEGLAKTWPDMGYRDEADFHARNYSKRGPNGLLRHCVGPHCMANGDGPYDLILGEFS